MIKMLWFTWSVKKILDKGNCPICGEPSDYDIGGDCKNNCYMKWKAVPATTEKDREIARRHEQNQKLLRKAMIIEILEQDKDKYKFIKGAFSDGGVGRCAMGVVFSRYGWNGNPDVKYLIPAQRSYLDAYLAGRYRRHYLVYFI
jgi:hypothetical protein